MSRVHDALRRAGQSGMLIPASCEPRRRPIAPAQITATGDECSAGLLELVKTIPYHPSPDALRIDAQSSPPAFQEEFRTLRTRLNHMQSLQPMHSVVITSPSPAEGKSFAAVNLALSEAQLAGNLTLLCDFDFRRPVLHNFFEIDRSPGITEYLLGQAQLHEAMRKVADTNLYFMPSGQAVVNPLELLNLTGVKHTVDQLQCLFNWVLLDTPPLLFAADANLLATFCHGSILVVRIGATTLDSITRAMQSLCDNNVLGIIVNGANRMQLCDRHARDEWSSVAEASDPEALDEASEMA
jgi:protein-tyrosine kinase